MKKDGDDSELSGRKKYWVLGVQQMRVKNVTDLWHNHGFLCALNLMPRCLQQSETTDWNYWKQNNYLACQPQSIFDPLCWTSLWITGVWWVYGFDGTLNQEVEESHALALPSSLLMFWKQCEHFACAQNHTACAYRVYCISTSTPLILEEYKCTYWNEKPLKVD